MQILNNTALLIIDMQNGFIDPKSSLCIAEAADTIDTCARVLGFARKAHLPIFHIRREYSYDGCDVEPVRLETWLKGGRPLCRKGDDPKSIEVPESLKELPSEQIIWKPRFSAFFQTNLHEILQNQDINTVMLIGTTTPNCIRTTCYDALSLNYDVIVVEDATSSRTPEVQRSNIADMEFIGAKVIRSSDL